jgi:ADP-ribose pyrophosphatase
MDLHKIIASNKLYSGKISVRSDKYYLGEKIVEKEIVEHPDTVGIIALDNKENMILVKQFRVATQNNLIEIPAGKIEKGEKPKDAAHREMNEEIGYSGKLTLLFQGYLAPGYDTEKMYFFLASKLKPSKKRLTQDDDEEITIKRIKLSSALKKCISGEIVDCKTIAAIMMISNSKYKALRRKIYEKSIKQ